MEQVWTLSNSRVLAESIYSPVEYYSSKAVGEPGDAKSELFIVEQICGSEEQV